MQKLLSNTFHKFNIRIAFKANNISYKLCTKQLKPLKEKNRRVRIN